MNNLPEELTLFIFSHLDIENVIKICTQVNKKWNYIVKQIRFHELEIRERIDVAIVKDLKTIWWSHSFKTIYLKNVIICKQLEFLNDSILVRNFINLKFLKLNIKEKFDLTELSQFSKLELLEFVNRVELSKSTVLFLPNLKTLRLFETQFSNFNNYKIKIHSFKLEWLSCSKLENIEFSEPQTVKFVGIEYCEDPSNIDKLINLETLKCNIDHLDPNIVIRSPNSLKQIHIYKGVKQTDRTYEHDEQILNRILGQKKTLYKSDLDVYFNGLILRNNELNSNQIKAANTEFVLDNLYELEEKVGWFTHIEYEILVKKFAGIIPNMLYIKFFNIRTVKVESHVNQELLLSFLGNCSNLIGLFIKYNLSFSQSFYDKIPDLCQFLELFILVDQNEIDLNFDFILKFKLLNRMQTSCNLPMSLIIRILENLKLIKYLSINNKTLIIKARKNLSFENPFRLKYEDVWINLNLEELLELCRDIDSRGMKTRLFPQKRTKMPYTFRNNVYYIILIFFFLVVLYCFEYSLMQS